LKDEIKNTCISNWNGEKRKREEGKRKEEREIRVAGRPAT
jgi:hypothetical protein